MRKSHPKGKLLPQKIHEPVIISYSHLNLAFKLGMDQVFIETPREPVGKDKLDIFMKWCFYQYFLDLAAQASQGVMEGHQHGGEEVEQAGAGNPGTGKLQ